MNKSLHIVCEHTFEGICVNQQLYLSHRTIVFLLHWSELCCVFLLFIKCGWDKASLSWRKRLPRNQDSKTLLPFTAWTEAPTVSAKNLRQRRNAVHLESGSKSECLFGLCCGSQWVREQMRRRTRRVRSLELSVSLSPQESPGGTLRIQMWLLTLRSRCRKPPMHLMQLQCVSAATVPCPAFWAGVTLVANLLSHDLKTFDLSGDLGAMLLGPYGQNFLRMKQLLPLKGNFLKFLT